MEEKNGQGKTDKKEKKSTREDRRDEGRREG